MHLKTFALRVFLVARDPQLTRNLMLVAHAGGVFYGQQQLKRRGDEVTLVRFSVQADGSVGGINTLPARLVERL